MHPAPRLVRQPARGAVVSALAVMFASVAAPSLALEDLRLRLGELAAHGWSAGAASLRVHLLEAGGVRLSLEARGVRPPGGAPRLQRVVVECTATRLSWHAGRCDNASVALDAGDRRVAASGGVVRYRMDAAESEVHVTDLRFAQGTMEARWSGDDGGWRARVDAREVALGALVEALAPPGGEEPPVAVDAGRVRFQAVLSGDARGQTVEVQAQIQDAAFSDAQGLRAGQGLAVHLAGSARRSGDGPWRTEAALDLPGGELYVDPVYLDISAQPLRLTLAGEGPGTPGQAWQGGWTLRHERVGRFEGELVWSPGAGLERASLRLPRSAVAPLYQVYGEPFTPGTPLASARVEGELALELEWAREAGAGVRARLYDIGVTDDAERFGVDGLRGEIVWAQAGAGERTRLAWEGARLYRVPLGGAELAGTFAGRGFRLDEPLRQPLLEGRFDIEHLEVSELGGDLAWRLGGRLQPISLGELSRALAWPPFGGTVSGEIPLVRYADGVVRVGGALAVRVFEGRVRIRELRLERPLGVVPLLRADIELEDLSLEALTEAFAFGKIQGTLGGRVQDLVLQDWEPQSFDAAFATPEDDPRRHRISQRAIENLTRLGGAGAALSQTFLRLFDEFSYDRLGLTCRLRNGVCEMRGVGDVNGGYYIVRGGGLPRVDVIGYNRRIDWDTLVERLERVTRSAQPVVR